MHPNDHVNASQSSNDVFPTAIHVAATASVTYAPAARRWSTWRRRCEAKADRVRRGGQVRPHAPDGRHAGDARAGVRRLRRADRATASSGCRRRSPRVAELPLGGTAVGTGINTPPGFAAAVIAELRRGHRAAAHRGARPLRGAGRAGRAGRAVAAQLRTIAVGLNKIANDLRWMGSGPRTGLAEIHLPDLQPGSSIMPGKVNPVIPEAVLHGRARRSSATTPRSPSPARRATSSSTCMMPVIARNLLESIRLLANVSPAAGRPVRRGHRRPTWSGCAELRRVLAVDRHAAEPLHRLRGGGRRSPSRRWRSARRSARSSSSAGYVDRRRAHRGAARRRARRAVHDPARPSDDDVRPPAERRPPQTTRQVTTVLEPHAK